MNEIKKKTQSFRNPLIKSKDIELGVHVSLKILNIIKDLFQLLQLINERDTDCE